jgi:hypothetical protein
MKHLLTAAVLLTLGLAATLAAPTSQTTFQTVYQTTLSTPITYNVTTGPGQTVAVTLNTITLTEVIDQPGSNTVIAYIAEIQQPVVVWTKGAYVAAGDWTHAQLMTRLQAILAGAVTDPSATS